MHTRWVKTRTVIRGTESALPPPDERLRHVSLDVTRRLGQCSIMLGENLLLIGVIFRTSRITTVSGIVLVREKQKSQIEVHRVGAAQINLPPARYVKYLFSRLCVHTC